MNWPNKKIKNFPLKSQSKQVILVPNLNINDWFIVVVVVKCNLLLDFYKFNEAFRWVTFERIKKRNHLTLAVKNNNNQICSFHCVCIEYAKILEIYEIKLLVELNSWFIMRIKCIIGITFSSLCRRMIPFPYKWLLVSLATQSNYANRNWEI